MHLYKASSAFFAIAKKLPKDPYTFRLHATPLHGAHTRNRRTAEAVLVTVIWINDSEPRRNVRVNELLQPPCPSGLSEHAYDTEILQNMPKYIF
jgi:hypothetical protein